MAGIFQKPKSHFWLASDGLDTPALKHGILWSCSLTQSREEKKSNEQNTQSRKQKPSFLCIILYQLLTLYSVCFPGLRVVVIMYRVCIQIRDG
jgi:hypothetical protein